MVRGTCCLWRRVVQRPELLGRPTPAIPNGAIRLHSHMRIYLRSE